MNDSTRQSPSGVSRRTFLKTSAAVVALPYFVPASALGKDGRPAPSNRIVMASIGIGSQGSGDLGNFLGRDDVQHVAVCDVKSDVREQKKRQVDQHNGNTDCIAYNDFRELLARTDIDAVNIATPDHWHAIITIEACKNGKDVYCQKPESLTVREGRAMVDAARRFNRVVSGGSQRVHEDYMDTVRKVWSGSVGTVKEINIQCGAPSIPCLLAGEPVPDTLDWDMWLGPAPLQPYHPFRVSGSYNIDAHNCWRSWRDFSGGGMTDWGAHKFGGAMFITDKMEQGPIAVYPPDAKHKTLTYEFKDGMLLYHNYPGRGDMDVVGDGSPIPAREIPQYKGQGGIYGDFIESVKSRERPFRDIERGHRTASICHLGNICYQLNRPLRWDPDKEVFPGDEQANRMLDRARREPWSI